MDILLVRGFVCFIGSGCGGDAVIGEFLAKHDRLPGASYEVAQGEIVAGRADTLIFIPICRDVLSLYPV
jgi:hypothetical protein